MCFDHCHDLFRGELSKNQVIFQNIHLRVEICGDLLLKKIFSYDHDEVANILVIPFMTSIIHTKYYKQTMYDARGSVVCLLLADNQNK